jgi:predicted nuclease of restriction endonuclease-like (RecB) superfamily
VFLSKSLRVTTFSNKASIANNNRRLFYELMRFNTSARSKTLALSVSSIWYGRRRAGIKQNILFPSIAQGQVIAASSLLLKQSKGCFFKSE